MAVVTSHVYPYAQSLINAGSINLTSATAGAFKMGLCTSAAATWGATQWAYQFVSSITGAYTEVSTGGYARVSLASLAVGTGTTAQYEKWTCTSPISFGSTITLAAASGFIYTTLVGSADASYPVVAIIDFGQTVTSTAGNWTYTIDPTYGLASWESI
jgi:hypothetical protein